MPELPEMENYRRLLLTRVAGKTVTGLSVTREKSINVNMNDFERAVVGRNIADVGRRAKQLIFVLEPGGHVLLLHLMLGGWLYWGSDEQKPERTVQVTLSFGSDNLYFLGLRLGYLHLMTRDEASRKLAKLGPEPLAGDFTAERLFKILKRKRGALKPLLTDQSTIAGIGNCYSDEICFAAGLLPSKSGDALSDEEGQRLYRAMQSVLLEAVNRGGYMESPLDSRDTLTGGYDDLCKVYDREGEPCYRCGNSIVRRDVASRKSFCCLHCQQ